MPTYEYKCDACGHQFEKFQSITAPAIKKCPVCGKQKVRRLIGPGAGLIFKGSGFYITDYRSDSYKNSAKSDNGTGGSSSTDGKPADSGAAPAPSGAAATESKPAAKTEAAATPKSEPKPPSKKKKD